ncbi:MAG: amidase [Chloroflexota bacterium]|nr:amidase [Chloroflexota bacterium]
MSLTHEDAPGAAARFATISELAHALRRKDYSARELALATCDLLEREGGRYNAVAAVMRKRALREAERADRANGPEASDSALWGIPYGAKDLLAARGAPTTWGAPPYRDQVIDKDATAIRRLRRAGAVLAAKLAMVELAGGGSYRYPSASLQGPGRNPWDLDRWSGGSSSGSAAAVAAGLVAYSLGSETSGSIGTPAAFCGVTGLRPTYGLVSRHGAMALSWTLDKIGPIAHSAEDCGTVLAALAGGDRADPTASGRRFRPLASEAAGDAGRRARVGYAEEDVAQHAAATAQGALAAGVAEFARGVGTLTRATLPEGYPYSAMVATVFGAEGASIFGELVDGGGVDALVDEGQKAGLRAADEIRARDYLHAMRLRTLLQHDFAKVFRDVDVLLTAGRTSTAPAIDQPLGARPPGSGSTPATDEKPVGNTPLIPAGNLAGLPAIFFPCGFGTDGLPVGLQLVGPPFSEPLLVALVSAYQALTDHHRKRPKV